MFTRFVASSLCRRSCAGFTLLELMVTIAIAAILGSLAAPALQDILIKSRLSGVGSQFSGHILRARNESVSRNTCTIMCLSTTTETTITTDASGNVTDGPVCANTGTDWQQGWIVFLQEDCTNSTSSAGSRPDRPEDYLLVRSPIGNNFKLEAQADNLTRLFFDASGRPRNDLNATLAAAAEFDLVYGSASSSETQKFGANICVDVMGRTRSIKPGSHAC